MQFWKRRGGLASPHEWWKSNAKRSPSDFGVAEHETAMRAVADALQYDPLVMVSLAAFEHLLGRALMVEYFHKDKVRIAAASSEGMGQIAAEEQDLFKGSEESSGAFMVAPSLVGHVAKELGRASPIDKQARKAREERALRR